MKNRNPASFFLCALLALPAGVLCLLQLVQVLHKEHRNERLAEEQQHTITVAASGLVWEEEGKEAWVNGRLFDISSYEHTDGVYRLTGAYDDGETSLLAAMMHWSPQKQASQVLQLLLLFQLYTESVFYLAMAAGLVVLSRYRLLANRLLPWPPMPTLSPPPQRILS